MKIKNKEILKIIDSIVERSEYLIAQALIPGGYGCIKKDMISELEKNLQDLQKLKNTINDL